jgi:hypothetical protein
MHCSYFRALAIHVMNQTIVKVLKINKYILCLMSKKTIYNLIQMSTEILIISK